MFKKVVAAALSCALMAPMLSALPQVQAEEEPDPFLIGTWFGSWVDHLADDPELLKTVFDDMEAAGVNYILNTGWQGDEGNAPLAEQCVSRDMYFTAAGPSISHNLGATDQQVQDFVAANKDLTNCLGYHLYDEPRDTLFPAVAKAFNKIKAADPDKFVTMNLLPSYGVLPSVGQQVQMGDSYEAYVQGWVDAVGAENLEYLSFDHYPFRAGGDSDTYFKDLEVIRKVAYRNGKLKTANFLQTGSWSGMRNPTAGEQRWNMYTSLAYGIKNPNYFCWMAPEYVAPPNGEGMLDHVVDREGNHTVLYEPAKQINSEVTALGPILMQVDAIHVYHTASTPKGVPSYPANYFIQPDNTTDDAIVSLMKCKDGSGYYVMIVNKNYSAEKSLSFTLDTEAVGITGVKEISKETGKPVACDYADGVLSATFAPGDGRLFKLEGNVDIPDPLQAPQASKRSGLYNDAVEVSLVSAVPEADIYYTLDGTYPDATKTKYEGPITIGSDTEDGQYLLRAVAVRGNEISEAAEYEYVVVNGPKNVALNKPVTFSCEVTGSKGTTDVINDGIYDEWYYVGANESGPQWAQIDFGKEYTIDRVNMCIYRTWGIWGAIIQFSNDPTFETGVTTVFNNDQDGNAGQGIGPDENYYTEDYYGTDFTFEPVTARYMRCWNEGNWGNGSMTWTEIQAYTASSTASGEALDTGSLENWQVAGGGTWVTEDGFIKQTDLDEAHANWNRSLTYTKKTYKNFILEGTFQFDTNDPAAWGFAGFGIRKNEIGDTQDTKGSGFYVAVEPKGRALVWLPGTGEMAYDGETYIPGFDITKPFDIKIVVLDDMISVSVNGTPVMTASGSDVKVSDGYLSIHAGLLPITVGNLKVRELEPLDIQVEQALKSTNPVAGVEVDSGTALEQAVAQLPGTATVTDTAEKTHTLNVVWTCPEYDGATAGTYTFLGSFDALPDGVVNTYGLTLRAQVTVKEKATAPSDTATSDGSGETTGSVTPSGPSETDASATEATGGTATTTTQTAPATGATGGILWPLLAALGAALGLTGVVYRKRARRA